MRNIELYTLYHAKCRTMPLSIYLMFINCTLGLLGWCAIPRHHLPGTMLEFCPETDASLIVPLWAD